MMNGLYSSLDERWGSGQTVLSYPSSIYPAFVNLVDNSIFWLQRRAKAREIELDAHGSDLLVRDNGPGVSARDRENVFALNFSRKPGGRGMGLHISRETLAKADLLLTLDQNRPNGGAVFRISPRLNVTTATEHD